MRTAARSVTLTLLLAGPLWGAEDVALIDGLSDFFRQHCDGCHADGESEGGLDLSQLSRELTDAEVMRRWVRVYDRVAGGEMPPEDGDLADGERQRFLARLGRSLDQADQREVVLRRLNRLEYENTLRDLFDLPHLEVKDMLPEDTRAHGFDNIGEALALSTEQMMVYLRAIDYVLDQALGPPEKPESRVRHSNLKESSQRVLGKLFREDPDGVVLFSSGYSPSAFRKFDIREPGVYRFKLRARPFQSVKPMILRVYAGDVIASRRDRWLSGYYDIAPGDDWTEIEFEERLEPYDSIKVVTYRNGGHEKNAKTTERPGILIGQAECEGPFIQSWPLPSRVKLLGDVDPENATEKDAVAILSRFHALALRRPTTTKELKPFADLTRQALQEERPWMEALRYGIKAILVSPQFLFLDEPVLEESVLEEPGRKQVDDFALASRLSYFLWRSMPDRRLLERASRGELRRPGTLRDEVERLLGDPKSQRFIDDFTGQWLDLYEIDFTEPDKNLFPEYDDLLRSAMLAESRGFFAEVLRENLSTREFIDADWTILNSRLAEHYGVPGVEGLDYRRVKLPADSPRGGVMTQAAVLKVTANGTNTSPVMRGVWMMENVFGQPVPPPPAGVPAVEPDISGATTLREQLDKHRNVASCAGCHNKIDPPGFALEQFDPIGGWRDWYRSTGEGVRINDRFIDPPTNKVRVRYRKGPPVDASGVTPAGESFADFEAFKSWLASNPEQMARNLAEKLLAFGLGRGTGFSDRAVLNQIVERSSEQDFGFRTLIHEVVQSEAFRKP